MTDFPSAFVEDVYLRQKGFCGISEELSFRLSCKKIKCGFLALYFTVPERFRGAWFLA